MNILDFAPPDESGEFFTGAPTEGTERFYHGTSKYFLTRIAEHGFAVRYRLVNDTQLAILSQYAAKLLNVGSLAWSLGAAKRLSLTRNSKLALSYAAGLRGGIYKYLLDDLTILLAPDAKQLPEVDTRVLSDLKSDLDALETEPGLVCAIDLNAPEVNRLDPSGQDPTYAPFDIPPDRIAAAMIIPPGYKYH